MHHSTLLSLRAVASYMVRQFILPYVLGGSLVILGAYAVLAFLATQHSVWWLLFLPTLVPITFVFVGVVILLAYVRKKLTPPMTKKQRQTVRQFVDRLATYSDIAGMSRFWLAFRVIRDVIRKRPRTYIGDLVGSSSELKRDFEAVRRSFTE